MEKWIEATGRTEDAAVQNALAQLGLDRDSVSVEILERARSGFFGIGGSPAKVKVTYEVPDEAPAPQQEATLSAPQKEKAPKEEMCIRDRLSSSLTAKMVWLIMDRRVCWGRVMEFWYSTVGSSGKSSGSMPMRSNSLMPQEM